MTTSERITALDEYCKKFLKEIEQLMEQNGHNFEETQFILDNALDLALTDARNEIYK